MLEIRLSRSGTMYTTRVDCWPAGYGIPAFASYLDSLDGARALTRHAVDLVGATGTPLAYLEPRGPSSLIFPITAIFFLVSTVKAQTVGISSLKRNTRETKTGTLVSPLHLKFFLIFFFFHSI